MSYSGYPKKQGLYDPALEKENCGVGFVAHIKGKASHEIIVNGLEILKKLDHRGAVGSDPLTGDGAGILIQIPHKFFKKHCDRLKIDLPEPGKYGVGQFFLPRNPKRAEACTGMLADIVYQEGLALLGWREVPVDNATIGEGARQAEPITRQIFIGAGDRVQSPEELERKLYSIRKQLAAQVRESGLDEDEEFYICTLSCKTLVYKGQLMSGQLETYYLDLKDPDMESALALSHSRYSTNTFPSWSRAQPLRFLAHNGEINTIRGNLNWMRAREALFTSSLYDDIGKILPVIEPGGSDSADFDQAFELLYLTGRSMAHSIMMMIPEPWSGHETMEPDKRGFYEYHASMMEPWDGPASIAFSDGEVIGAVLDRNGLRPSRYIVTKDDLVIMASEVGVLPVDEANIQFKGRLQPGKMFLVDLREGRIIADEEIKARICARRPYARWVRENQVNLEDLPAPKTAFQPNFDSLLLRQKVFGYTTEDLKIVLAPMVGTGEEAAGSMGNDVPLAVLSDKPQLLFNYFKQLFAQVTNPAIDSIREELVMSMEVTLGKELDLLSESPHHCRKLKIQHPILTAEEMAKIQELDQPGIKTVVLPMLFPASEGEAGLEQGLERLCQKASEAIRDGASILILSDRGMDAQNAAIPSLLATAAVHHHLLREVTRTSAGIVVETAEAREMMHFALLIGYGASAIYP
ncbi:MAG: glutamate synthase central domain-containing protein, partial [Nitrospinales bacterium]